MRDFLKMAREGELQHTDLTAAVVVEDGDAVQHGVIGQKWGVRRSSAALRAAAAKRGESPKKEEPKKEEPTKKVVGAASGETSAARYNRLREQAKAQGPNSLDEQDLKFLNARADAIAKVQKMNETQPGWLSSTSKKVLQQAAQNTMQDVANGLTKHYISGPLLESVAKKK